MRFATITTLTLKLVGLLAVAMLCAVPTGSASTPGLERIIVVRPGDTLAALLTGAGIDQSQVHGVVTAITPLFPPRSLRPGQEVAIHLDPEQDDTLVALEVEPAPGRTIRARLEANRWQVDEVLAPKQRMLALAAGSADGGLFPAATSAGLPAGLALSLVRILGHQIDFQRDIQPGDTFSILFERFRDNDGSLLGHGQVLHVELMLSGKRLAFWRHQTRDGGVDWFDTEGRSVRRSFLRTPLDSARVSSGFGLRKHPILGFTRMHQGTDFAAPHGTQVYAAADGTVISVRNERGYGRIVRLRHAGQVETRYAHLSTFARGMAPGRKIKQGDLIGRVGSTGMATGPHLHYEVVVASKPVDPAKQMTRSVRLSGAELATFRTARQSLAYYSASLGPLTEVAMAE